MGAYLIYRVVFSRKTDDKALYHSSPWYNKRGIIEFINYLLNVPDVQIEKIERIADVTSEFAQYKFQIKEDF